MINKMSQQTTQEKFEALRSEFEKSIKSYVSNIPSIMNVSVDLESNEKPFSGGEFNTRHYYFNIWLTLDKNQWGDMEGSLVTLKHLEMHTILYKIWEIGRSLKVDDDDINVDWLYYEKNKEKDIERIVTILFSKNPTILLVDVNSYRHNHRIYKKSHRYNVHMILDPTYWKLDENGMSGDFENDELNKEWEDIQAKIYNSVKLIGVEPNNVKIWIDFE